jgi:hypothetical protein
MQYWCIDGELRNNSWNPYCVLSFNMGWWILAARDKLYYYFTCDKSTTVYRMVAVNYFTCDNSTNVHRMVIVNYFTCDKSTNATQCGIHALF